jgi:hypothetical protein
MYDTYQVGTGVYSYGTESYDGSNVSLFGYNWPDPTTDSSQYSTYHAAYSAYTANSPQTNDYILFVPGWRMLPSDDTDFANTSYKRLFWQGYKGRFGTFNWPTEWINTTGASKTTLLTDPAKVYAIGENFAESEQRALFSATALEALLTKLAGQYTSGSNGSSRVNVLSHSMGSYVVSEALRLAITPGGTPIVNTYIASQGATPAEAYDGSGPGSAPRLDEFAWLTGDLSGMTYYGDIGASVSHLVNYYNPLDFALAQEDVLNAVKDNYSFGGYSTEALGDYRFYDSNGFALDNWKDRYSILAFAGINATNGIGKSANVGGPFDQSKQIDVATAFGFNGNTFDHSAEFMGTNAQRGDYWNQVLKTFGL